MKRILKLVAAAYLLSICIVLTLGFVSKRMSATRYRKLSMQHLNYVAHGQKISNLLEKTAENRVSIEAVQEDFQAHLQGMEQCMSAVEDLKTPYVISRETYSDMQKCINNIANWIEVCRAKMLISPKLVGEMRASFERQETAARQAATQTPSLGLYEHLNVMVSEHWAIISSTGGIAIGFLVWCSAVVRSKKKGLRRGQT